MLTLEERIKADGYEGAEPVMFFGGPFSNFSAHGVVLPNPWTGRMVRYPTGEHRFQAMKATTKSHHDFVLAKGHPSKAKEAGRSINLRDGWGSDYGDLCWYVMVETVVAKAMQHADVMRALTETMGRPIYEDSPTDAIWGVRTAPETGTGPGDFRGKNLLGRAWMRARTVLVP